MDMTNKNKGDVIRFMRWLNIWALLPGFPFLLAHGISTSRVVPALGIAPLAISAVVAIVHLTTGVKQRAVSITVDLFLVAFLIGVLVPSWLTISDDWREDTGEIMVGTYGTTPMMISFLLHCWFVLRELHIPNPFVRRPQRCPHCFGDIQHPKGLSGAHSHDSNESNEPYEVVSTVDSDAAPSMAGPSYRDLENKEPRPSTDDETARLV